MSLTRGMLKGMGLTEEQVSAIIDAHTETVDGLKETIKAVKAEADKLPEIQKELDALKVKNGDDYKSKFEKEHSDFEEYKKSVASEKAENEKKNLYRELLRDAGVDPKRIDSVLRVTDLSKVSVKDGKLEDAETLLTSIKTDWADFIGKVETRGAKVPNPPASIGGKMTKEEIMAIKDDMSRQKAIAENHELFGF